MKIRSIKLTTVLLLPFILALSVFPVIADGVVRNVDRGADVLRGADKADNIVKIPISKLYGHETTDVNRLFREGAKTHHSDSIEVIKIENRYMINDGVGRSMRALKAGEKVVNARVIRTYPSVEEMSRISKYDNLAKTDKIWWEKRVTKIDDSKRWKELFGG